MRYLVRRYVVDEDDNLHRIPLARYRRILDGQEAVYLYAGREIRFVEAMVTRVKVVDGEEVSSFAYFPLVYFDAAGRVDPDQRLKELKLVRDLLAVEGQKEWEELYRAERDAHFRWQPSAKVQAQLQAIAQAVERRIDEDNNRRGEL